MKFYHNYQNDWKGKLCEHVYIVLEEKNGILKKCIRCYRISESQAF